MPFVSSSFLIFSALLSHFAFPSLSLIVSSRRRICVADIFEREEGPVAVEPTFEDILGGRSKAAAVGDPTPGPVKEGEYAPVLL
jgi:hypothetical protein